MVSNVNDKGQREKSRTLCLIKPITAQDASAVKEIWQILQSHSFNILTTRHVQMSYEMAQALYIAHKDRDFFFSLISFMTSDKCYACVLEGIDAVRNLRNLMGDTNPSNAAHGTLRHQFGQSIQYNAVHGTDTAENTECEINIFFPWLEKAVSI